jgi:hypothetical protein
MHSPEIGRENMKTSQTVVFLRPGAEGTRDIRVYANIQDDLDRAQTRLHRCLPILAMLETELQQTDDGTRVFEKSAEADVAIIATQKEEKNS